MSKSRKEMLSELHDSVVEQINAFNKAIHENDLSAMSKAETSLKEAEAEYAETKALEVFDKLGEMENPIKAGIIEYSYPVLSHKNIREDGKITGIELVEDKMRQIDLVKLAKYCGIKCDWQYMIEKFNQLLCLRAARELKLPKAEVNKICDSFYMNKLSRAVELGETPDSNTQICKQLQTIMDAMVFEDNGKGKNIYKVNNHDVAYLLMCYTQKGRKALTIRTQKHAVVHRLVMDIEHRVILNKKYDLEYKVDKGEKVSEKEPKPKTEKVSEENSETKTEDVTEVEKK